MVKKRFSNTLIRKAGYKLKQNEVQKSDLDIISTFRVSHIPLMKMLVKTISKKLPKPILIARRLKRLSSITKKLKRFDNMKLDRMQDIGGVRAIFKNNNEVMQFVKNIQDVYYAKKSALNIIKENDYIACPKEDGYRSYHIIFRYNGKSEELQGYHIELQLRSLLQHYWATAVEILALQSNTNIKAGYGDEHYKRFFWLCAELLAGNDEYKNQIKLLDDEYHILELLDGISVVANKLNKDEKTQDFYLIILDYKEKNLQLISFDKDAVNQAKQMYQALETSEDMDSVLVSIDSVKSLKKAYPNYFLDAKKFIDEVSKRLKN